MRRMRYQSTNAPLHVSPRCSHDGKTWPKPKKKLHIVLEYMHLSQCHHGNGLQTSPVKNVRGGGQGDSEMSALQRARREIGLSSEHFILHLTAMLVLLALR